MAEATVAQSVTEVNDTVTAAVRLGEALASAYLLGQRDAEIDAAYAAWAELTYDPDARA